MYKASTLTPFFYFFLSSLPPYLPLSFLIFVFWGEELVVFFRSGFTPDSVFRGHF